MFAGEETGFWCTVLTKCSDVETTGLCFDTNLNEDKSLFRLADWPRLIASSSLFFMVSDVRYGLGRVSRTTVFYCRKKTRRMVVRSLQGSGLRTCSISVSCFQPAIMFDENTSVEHTLDKRSTHSQAKRQGTQVEEPQGGCCISRQRLKPFRIYSKREFNGTNVTLFRGSTMAIPCWSSGAAREVLVRSLTKMANSGKRVEQLEPSGVGVRVPPFVALLIMITLGGLPSPAMHTAGLKHWTRLFVSVPCIFID